MLVMRVRMRMAVPRAIRVDVLVLSRANDDIGCLAASAMTAHQAASSSSIALIFSSSPAISRDPARTARAARDDRLRGEFAAALVAGCTAVDLTDVEPRAIQGSALRNRIEAERDRIRHDAGKSADIQYHTPHASAGRRFADDGHDVARDGEFVHGGNQQISRQLVADQHVDDALPAEHRAHHDLSWPAIDDATDEAGAGAEVMGAHGGKRRLGLRPGRYRDEPAFVREIQRIEAEDLAEALDRFADRHAGFVDLDAASGGFGDLVEHRRDTAARCVAHEARARGRGQQRIDQSVQRCAVAVDRRVQMPGRRAPRGSQRRGHRARRSPAPLAWL